MPQSFAFLNGIITCHESEADFKIHGIMIEQRDGNTWYGWYGLTLRSQISDQPLPEEGFDIRLSTLTGALEIKNCKRINDRVFEFDATNNMHWRTK